MNGRPSRTFSRLGGGAIALALSLGVIALTDSNLAAATALTPGVPIASSNTPTKGADPGTDNCAPEWHWIVNGLDAPTANDIPANLPGTIQVTWSDASVSNVAFDKAAGGAVHYLTTDHVSDGVYPTAATIVFPVGTRFSSFNNFVLSHGPCPPDTPSTDSTTPPTDSTTPPTDSTTPPTDSTTPPTDSTTPPTDSTTPPTDSTTPPTDSTAPPSSIEPSTSVESGGPVPTPAPSSSLSPFVAPPAPPTGLPVTGSSSSSLAMLAGVLLLIGTTLMIIGRRRTA